MPESRLTVEQILPMLAVAPACIAGLTAGLTEAQLQAAPAPGEWSINEVLAHLRSCADVWGSAMALILEQEASVIRAIDPRTWVRRTDYPGLEFLPSLQAYTAQRAELLAVLQPLEPGCWSRSATVTGADKPLERSLLSFASRLARHERTHLKQIRRTAGAIRG